MCARLGSELAGDDLARKVGKLLSVWPTSASGAGVGRRGATDLCALHQGIHRAGETWGGGERPIRACARLDDVPSP